MNVFNELNTVKLNLCYGPDNLSLKFVIECHFILSYPLYFLFNQSLTSRTFLTSWKTVLVSPKFKNSDRSSYFKLPTNFNNINHSQNTYLQNY